MATDHNLTLGEFLRQERERRGLTIEQVASATKIGVRLLHALEADHYIELPAKPFIRGFVTSYARFMGIDPKEILNTYDAFIESRSHERPNLEAGHSGYAFDKRDGEQRSRTILSIVMGVFIVLGAVVFIVLKPSLHHKRGSHIDKLRAAHGVSDETPGPEASVAALALNSPTPVPSPSPTPTAVAAATPSPAPTKTKTPPKPSPSPTPTATAPVAVATPAPTPSASLESNPNDPLDSGKDLKAAEIKHKLILEAIADIWVRYQVDARKTRRFIMRKGSKLVLRARDSIKFQISNPKSATLNYNSTGTKPLAANKNIVTRQGSATLFFPPKLADTIQEPFPGDRPLSPTADPVPESTAHVSTPPR